MKLYHVTGDMLHSGQFTPRIPTSRLRHEDDSIERVCFSTSLEGCFTSMPGGGELLDESVEDFNGMFRVFEIDTEDFHPRHIITSEQLVRRCLVPDAGITGEYWITKEFQARSSNLIQLHSFKVKKKNVEMYWKGERISYGIHTVKKLDYSSDSDNSMKARFPSLKDEELERVVALSRELNNYLQQN